MSVSSGKKYYESIHDIVGETLAFIKEKDGKDVMIETGKPFSILRMLVCPAYKSGCFFRHPF